MKKRVIFISIVIIIILCAIFCNMSLNDSNDTFYLIKLGQSILKNGVDKIDHFSWIPNLPYMYPHWLYSVFIFFVYNNFGYTGVYISTLVSFIALMLIIYYVNLKINKDRFLALVVVLISIIPLHYFAQPRSQLLSIIFMFLEVYYIHQLIDTGKKKYIAYLSLCSLFVANIHATAWIGMFVFFLPFFGEHLVYLYSKKKNKKISLNGRISINKVNNIKLVFIAFIACLVMGIFSPTQICYTYFFRTILGDSQEYIIEHFPIVVIEFPLIIILWFFMFFSKSKIKLSEFFMLCGITLMSLMSQRHLIFFCTIGVLYFAIVLKRNVDEKQDQTFSILEKKIFNNYLISSLIIVALIGVCVFKINSMSQKGFFDNKTYPIEAVKYIKENLDYKNIKIINGYNFGSYLLFNDIKVFIDSRCDLYYKEFNMKNMDILDDYFDVFSSSEKGYDYNKLRKKYDAQYFLISNDYSIYYMLKNDSKYEMVYSDDSFGLYKLIEQKQS